MSAESPRPEGLLAPYRPREATIKIGAQAIRTTCQLMGCLFVPGGGTCVLGTPAAHVAAVMLDLILAKSVAATSISMSRGFAEDQ
jgi:hypothetical protein